jgi:AcrR family transcriptional regulator
MSDEATSQETRATEATTGWQAQKSAATRNLIVEAAIRCFIDLGYASTTTTRIAEKAGLSRGAMLHHFPSKIDIVRAAVAHLHAKRLKAFRASIAAIPEGSDRVRIALDAYWRHVNHPMFVAFFELSVAARTDKELETILRPAQAAFDDAWYQTAQELFPEWQSDPEAFDVALELTRYVMEGMAVNFLTHEKTKRDERVLAYLEQQLRALRPAGSARQAGSARLSSSG